MATPTTKAELRETIRDRRRRRPAERRALVAEALSAHVTALPEVVRARTVGCYLSAETEPGTGPLIEALLARRTRVLVPIARRGQMRWVEFDATTPVVTSPFGVPEPDSSGDEDPSDADVILVPGLAVDGRGSRLGQGGGYYDRQLAQISVATCLLLHADEVLPHVPGEPHDVRVDMVATELGVSHLGEGF